MTPEDQEPRRPDDADHDEVRRLLAAAGEDPPPMPVDVASHLDDVLAGLVAERTESPTARVTELTTRRRPSRRWPGVLVAAAAVSVLGLGVGNLMDGSVQSADSAAGGGANESAAESNGGTDDLAAAERPSEESAGQALTSEPPETMADSDTYSQRNLAGLPRLRSGSLTADVQRVAGFTLDEQSSHLAAETCEVPVTARGDEQFAVRLDGAPATLVLRAPDQGRRLAEVYACDDASSPAATTTIPAR